MPRRQTPLEVMFSLFKTSFTLSHRAVAELLLSDLPLTNGQPTAQMATGHAAGFPDDCALAAGLPRRSPLCRLVLRIESNPAQATGKRVFERRHDTIIAAATDAMAQALSACGRNGLLYRNAASRLVSCQLDKDDRALIIVPLFRPPVGAIRPVLSLTSGTALNSQRMSGRLPPQVFLSVHAI